MRSEGAASSLPPPHAAVKAARPPQAQRAPARPLSAPSSDLLVYAAIALAVGAARWVTGLHLFKAGDDVGYWLGVAGATMMLLLLGYPLRKHFRFAHGWGRLKVWLVLHMLLGVGGPVLILVHSGFQFGSLNAGVALWSMIVVALSGVVGRFIYTRVNRGLHGESVGLRELKLRAGIEQGDAYSRLAFAPEVEALLLAFEKKEAAQRPGWRTHFRRVIALPWMQWRLYRRCVRLLQAPLHEIEARRGWTRRQRAEHERLARKLVRQYLNAVVRVAQFGSYEWMLSAWHVAHIPFVFLLVVSVVIHVFAVHAY